MCAACVRARTCVCACVCVREKASRSDGHHTAAINRLLKIIGLFCRALLQKRPMILRSLLIVATPYEARSAAWLTATCCIILQHAATYCIILQHIATHYNTLQHAATRNAAHRITGRQKTTWLWSVICNVAHCNILQHPASCCNTLQHTATLCNILQRIMQHTLQHRTAQDDVATECDLGRAICGVADCNVLQHTATYCNILQHTATRCNILQHAMQHTLQHRTAKDDVAAECNPRRG